MVREKERGYGGKNAVDREKKKVIEEARPARLQPPFHPLPTAFIYF